MEGETTTRMTEKLREYLEFVAANTPAEQGSFERVVAERGRECEPAEYDAGRYGTEYCVAKECSKNAAMLAMENTADLTYCEGFAYTEFFPMWHAWCIDKAGRVVDPTWAGDDTSDGLAYYGVEMSAEELLQALGEKRLTGRCTYGIFDWPGWYDGVEDEA